MNSEYFYSPTPKLDLVKNWRNSLEYVQLCAHFRTVCDELIEIGVDFAAKCDIHSRFEETVVRTVCASDGGLHRGVYCPSPVYDIIVGNVTRGMIRNRISAKSKSHFLYGFNAKDQLVYVKHFWRGSVACIEYLLYQKDCIYGVSIDKNSDIQCVTKEHYQDGSLISYTHALIAPEGKQYSVIRMHAEQYEYGSGGLQTVQWYDYTPMMNSLNRKDYHFTNEDGYLTLFYETEIVGRHEFPSKQQAPKYSVRIKRESFFDPFKSCL